MDGNYCQYKDITLFNYFDAQADDVAGLYRKGGKANLKINSGLNES